MTFALQIEYNRRAAQTVDHAESGHVVCAFGNGRLGGIHGKPLERLKFRKQRANVANDQRMVKVEHAIGDWRYFATLRPVPTANNQFSR